MVSLLARGGAGENSTLLRAEGQTIFWRQFDLYWPSMALTAIVILVTRQSLSRSWLSVVRRALAGG